MTHSSFFLSSDYDGARIALTEISADEPRFLVQILHGMAEHHRRYFPFMEYLASAGGAVIAHDLRGHGETAGKENLGYFGEDAVEAILSDVHQVEEVLRRKYPDRPFLLIGHSMGSLIARLYAAENDELLDGMLLLGEVSYNPLVGWGLLLAHLWELFCGGRYCSKTITSLATGAYNHGFPPEEAPGNRFLWMSADRENRVAFEADPACGFDFTVNGHLALFSFLKQAYAPKNWNVRNPGMPVRFLSGEYDPIMTDKKHFDDAVRFMRDMGYRDVSSHLYPGMRHEILNEAEHERVWRDILSFIEEKVIKFSAPM